jgi:hypothetical protein
VNNRYPYFNSNDLKTAYYMEQSFVDKQKYKDPRLFKMAEKSSVDTDLVNLLVIMMVFMEVVI